MTETPWRHSRALVDRLVKQVHAEAARQALGALDAALCDQRAALAAGRDLADADQRYLAARLDELEATLRDLIEEHMRAFGLGDVDPPASPAPSEPKLRVV